MTREILRAQVEMIALPPLQIDLGSSIGQIITEQ
jgi:hypothetical protein